MRGPRGPSGVTAMQPPWAIWSAIARKAASPPFSLSDFFGLRAEPRITPMPCQRAAWATNSPSGEREIRIVAGWTFLGQPAMVMSTRACHTQPMTPRRAAQIGSIASRPSTRHRVVALTSCI